MLCMEAGFRSKETWFKFCNQMVQKWIVQRNSPILFWRFRGEIDSNSLSITSDISNDLAKVNVDWYNSSQADSSCRLIRLLKVAIQIILFWILFPNYYITCTSHAMAWQRVSNSTILWIKSPILSWLIVSKGGLLFQLLVWTIYNKVMSCRVNHNCLVVVIFSLLFSLNLSNLPSNDVIVGAFTTENGRLFQPW